MDRSFLSQSAVIAASRAYVCVRLATYEDEKEADFLKGLIRTRSGELENSTFAILASDGKTKLTTAGRGPRRLYSDANDLADDLTRLARPLTPKAELSSLPFVANLRLAVDIAAADNLPLIVLVGKNQALERQVSSLAWSKDYIGRYTYVRVESAKDLSSLSGVEEGSGLLVVEPDKFGLKGKVLAQVGAGAAPDRLRETLVRGSKSFSRVAASQQSHIRDGRREKIFWVPALPVTDPEEARARQRGR